MKDKSAVLITSSAPRHQFFVETMSERLDVRLVISEEGDVNTEDIVNLIEGVDPDIIFTFGCNLLKGDIYKIPKLGCVNIHTGLVQNYRGVDSSFWAMHDRKPEAVGFTLHFVDDSIDAGDVIFQGRPKLSRTDSLDEVFLKTCKEAIESLARKAPEIMGGVAPAKLARRGKLYQSKDMGLEIKTKVEKMLPDVLSGYLDNKQERDKEIELISCLT